MRIFLFQITYKDGSVTISQVHCKNRIMAMVYLSLVSGCEDVAIDFISEEDRYTDIEFFVQFN